MSPVQSTMMGALTQPRVMSLAMTLDLPDLSDDPSNRYNLHIMLRSCNSLNSGIRL